MTEMPNSLLRYCGIPVIARAHLTVKRTWRERLLTWPWRPWVAHKPSNEIFITKVMGQARIYCHPRMFERIKRVLALEVDDNVYQWNRD